MQLHLLQHEYAIVRLAPQAPLPNWVNGINAQDDDDFVSVTRTREELSIVCRASLVTAARIESSAEANSVQKIEAGWRVFRVAGQLTFDQVGIIAGLARPVAEREIPLFCVSTFDTDYILIKQPRRMAAAAAWTAAGHTVLDIDWAAQ